MTNEQSRAVCAKLAATEAENRRLEDAVTQMSRAARSLEKKIERQNQRWNQLRSYLNCATYPYATLVLNYMAELEGSNTHGPTQEAESSGSGSSSV